tara:strand:+ start:172 stop:459 length:288 start_codon:yes stop_codon:yes gene_type:complete
MYDDFHLLALDGRVELVLVLNELALIALEAEDALLNLLERGVLALQLSELAAELLVHLLLLRKLVARRSLRVLVVSKKNSIIKYNGITLVEYSVI